MNTSVFAKALSAIMILIIVVGCSKPLTQNELSAAYEGPEIKLLKANTNWAYLVEIDKKGVLTATTGLILNRKINSSGFWEHKERVISRKLTIDEINILASSLDTLDFSGGKESVDVDIGVGIMWGYILAIDGKLHQCDNYSDRPGFSNFFSELIGFAHFSDNWWWEVERQQNHEYVIPFLEDSDVWTLE